MTHTKEPWAYRPHEDDDWGIIRAPVTEQGQWLGGVICQARDPERLGESELAAARAAKVDPWEANARRIVECVNALAGTNPAALAGLIEAADNLLLTFDSYGKERLPEYVRKEFARYIAALRARGVTVAKGVE
jgi:hypothetical protein